MTLKHVLRAGVVMGITLLAGGALFFLGNQRLALAEGSEIYNRIERSLRTEIPEAPPFLPADTPQSELGEEVLCRVYTLTNEAGAPFPKSDVGICGEQGGEEPPPPPPGDGEGDGGGGGGGGLENTLALCTDGVDNDGDSKVDLEDPDCASFRPTLTVTLVIVNDNNGTTTPSDYSLSVKKTTPDSSESIGIASGFPATLSSAGVWKLEGFQKPGYTATFSGDCNAVGEVTISAGETKNCTITSNDVAPGAPQCSDGIDNDGDGVIDGQDPGCSDPSDNDETNPSSGGGNPSTGGGSSGGGGGGSGSALANQQVATTSAAQEVLNGAATQITACDQYLTEFIRTGRENNPEQVRRLQAALIEFEQADIEVTGVYDAETLAAVHAFQTKYASRILTPWGIKESTGYVYLTTRKTVNEIYCRETKLFPLTTAEQQIIDKARAENLADTGIGGAPANVSREREDSSESTTSQAGAAAAADATTLWDRIRGFFRSIRGHGQ